MRNFILLILVLFTFSSFSVDNKFVAPATTPPSASIQIDPTAMEKLAKMKIKEAEKLLGRKFTFREKIAFKLTQLKLKKEAKAKAAGKSSKGQTAFILSLIGLCILIVPYASIASLPLAIIGLVMGSSAKRENPDDNKARTAVILSLITLGLIALAVLLVVAILASGDFWY